MFNLKSVRLEGFRGFPKASGIFEFSAPAVLLYGDNHQGKSSVLNAIEWCLYGDQCLGAKSGIRERVGGWEVVNRRASFASVEVTVETDDGVVAIRRRQRKARGKKGRSTEVTLADGTVVRGGHAEREITKVIRLSFRDFATAVYQHQETIRAILVQTPRERNDAIDRLLGLGDYRNILEGIKKAKLPQLQRQLAREKKEFEGLVEQALKIRRDDLQQKRQEAIAEGLEPARLNEEGLLELASGVARQVDEFACQLGIASTPPALPSGWKEVDSFVDKVREEIDRLWSQAADVKEQSELNKRRNDTDRIRLRYDERRNAVAEARAELRGFQTQHGERDEIDRSMLKIRGEIDGINTQIRDLSPKAKLVEEGIALLKEVPAGEAAELCPLCGKRVPNLLEHLEKKWTEEIEEQVRALKVATKELEGEKKELEARAAEHVRLTQLVEDAKAQLKASSDATAQFLAREVTDEDDPSALLSKEMERIGVRLQVIERAIKEKRGRLGAVSESITRALLVYEFLELEGKIRAIESIAATEEYKVLEWVRDQFAELVSDVDALSTLARECLTDEARDRMETAGAAIDTYFRKITGHPGVQHLRVEIEEDARSGGNSYTFCDQDGQELSPVLSHGDLNCLALSMFLGLVAAYSHAVGFVLMDDPSQSLGSDQKRRLVEVLEEVCERGRRIVLATMDAELQDLLKSHFGKAKAIYQIHDWAPESGPTVSLEA